jgi:hypothetical protein
MTIQFWRLSEGGESNLGLACTADGLVLGRTPLIARCGERFIVRDQREIERLFSRAYRDASAVERIMSGLRTVAAALDGDDRCLACIAAVHLRIPDLPDFSARERMEAEDALIKYARGEEPDPEWDPAKHPRTGTPPNAGWFAPTDGGSSESSQIRTAANEEPNKRTDAGGPRESKLRVMRLAMRRALRIAVLRVLRMGAKAAGELIPIIGQIVTVFTEAAEIVGAAGDLRRLQADARAALDFAKEGPHQLKDLQVSSNGYEEFSGYGQFTKIALYMELLIKRFGPAGDGYQYHHIVTQGGANQDNIPPGQLQNTENIIRIPTILHEAINEAYSKKKEGTNMTVYQWIQTQPYDVQRQEGLKILRKLHIIE